MTKAIIHQKKDILSSNVKSFILIEPLNKTVNISLTANTSITVNKLSKETLTGISSLTKKIIKKSENGKQNEINKNRQLVIHSQRTKIAKKYFRIWKNIVMKRKKDKEKKAKIDTFVEQLKERKKETISKCKNNFRQEEKNKMFQKHGKKQDITEMYKIRYKTQQNLIKIQQTKLQEQEKIIENLRLGIIIEETETSLENSKYEIKEIFRKCSEKVRCRITPPEAVDKNLHIELKSNKAPKILVQLEKRAIERSIRRNLILEKKKFIEKEKRKEIENAIKQKKATDKEQIEKNLKNMNEKRRLEIELEKKKQENKQKYLESIYKANKHYIKKIKRKFFNSFKKLVEIKYETELKCELFYRNLLKKKILNNWKIYVEKKMEQINFDADCLYNHKLLRKHFKTWYLILKTRKQSMQVAEDLYDMKLQSKVFLDWHRFICKQQMLEYRNLKKAERHYNSRILLQYFYQWKSLPTILQLEKGKEEKKRKWREKVWEIVPDYQPCTDFF